MPPLLLLGFCGICARDMDITCTPGDRTSGKEGEGENGRKGERESRASGGARELFRYDADSGGISRAHRAAPPPRCV